MRCIAARRLVDSSFSLLLRGPDEHLPHQQGPKTASGLAAHVRGSEVPYPIEFFSGIGGRTMPYYDEELEQVWAQQFAGALIWGWEYVLAHHYNANQEIRAFPSNIAVVQWVAWDGLIEWSDGYEEPLVADFHEELKLYGNSTIDIHAFYVGYRTIPIRRIQLGFLVESSVMPRAFNHGPNHSLLRDLSLEELAFFGDSLTLDTFDFWELAIDVPGLLTHSHTWWSQTFDPAQGGAVTWESGVFNYQADSATRRVTSLGTNRRRPSSEVLHRETTDIGFGACRLSVRSLSYGLSGPTTSFEWRNSAMHVMFQIGGAVKWTRWERELLINEFAVCFNEVREPTYKERTLLLPAIGRYQVSVRSVEELLDCVTPRVLIWYAR